MPCILNITHQKLQFWCIFLYFIISLTNIKIFLALLLILLVIYRPKHHSPNHVLLHCLRGVFYPLWGRLTDHLLRGVIHRTSQAVSRAWVLRSRGVLPTQPTSIEAPSIIQINAPIISGPRGVLTTFLTTLIMTGGIGGKKMNPTPITNLI